MLSLVALAILLCSPHRIRLAVGSYVSIDSLEVMRAGPLDNDAMRFLPVISNEMFPRQDATDAIAILTVFDRSHPAVVGDALPMLDDPDSCLRALQQSRAIHCYNVDIGIARLLARFGFYTRLWDLAGRDGLGGNGHNLIEVWDAPAQSWRTIDPYYHCYYTIGASDTPAGFAALRRALVAGDPSVRAIRYFEYPNERTPVRVVSELRLLVPCSILHANNDFAWRYAHRYGGLTPLAPLLDRLPLRAARGARTMMLGARDARYIVQDAYSPHFEFSLIHWSARVLLGLVLLSGLLLILTAIARKRRR
ncbi:MAG: hypothetical protein Q8921_00700 [Bacteroidota bacterium]|nr:hypothetical protein [Bacteroidota bacterium]